MPVTPPFVELALVGGGTVAVNPQFVTSVRTNPLTLASSFLDAIASQGIQSFEVVGDADAVTLALASGGMNVPLGTIVAAANVDALGNILWGFNLAPLPYVPGSGDYAFNIVNYQPGNYAVQSVKASDPPAAAVISAFQSAPPFVQTKLRNLLGVGIDSPFSIIVVKVA